MLTEDQRTMLKGVAASRAAPLREVVRAQVLLGYAEGASITDLQRQIGLSRPAIYTCIDKAPAAGAQMGLKDTCHRPHEPEITDAAKAWVVSIVCTKPRDHGLAAELWSILLRNATLGVGAQEPGRLRRGGPMGGDTVRDRQCGLHEGGSATHE